MKPLRIRSSQSSLGVSFRCCPSCSYSLLSVVPQTGGPNKRRGRNAEGQCGVENKPVCVEPVVLHSLESAGVQSVLAGKVHSAAILRTGEVCTWGCGKAGKLGHGSSENYSEPTR